MTAIYLRGFDRMYENIIFYKDGETVFTTASRCLCFHDIDKAGNVYSVSDYDRELIAVNITEPHRALKLNLNRKDNFYMKHPGKTYSFDPANDLYIYCGDGGDAVLEYNGEKLAFEHDGEKDFMETYTVTFKTGYQYKKYIIERYSMENPLAYALQPGESFGDGYGSKDRPVIKMYDNSDKMDLLEKIHGENAKELEKGIMKKYTVIETGFAGILITSPYYTRIEKDTARQDREKLAKIISGCLYSGKTVSHYEVENLLEKLNISIKQ